MPSAGLTAAARSLASVVCLIACGLWVTDATAAPEASVRVSPGPYFVGVPLHVELRISDIEESPPPSVDVSAPDGANLELVSTAPRISSSIQIINGKMTRWKDVSYVLRYRLTPTREGVITVGPFNIEQEQLRITAPARRLDVGTVPQSDEQYLSVSWPERTLWVGERVTLVIEWWVSTGLAERIASRSVNIPLFNMTEALRFTTPPDRGAQNTLVVQTTQGRVELPANVRRETRDGREYLVLRAERIMTPLVAADLRMQPATVVVEEAVRWQRNLFGERVATDVRRVQAQSEGGTIKIREPPSNGRPASFAGIVGTGFTVTVSANRSVVNVGDPIGLEVTVRGDGALDTLALPDFAALGFGADDFKTPANTIAGRIEADGAKRFRFNVRPLHDEVDAIPALTLSWFDADTGTYASTQSAPVALSVRAAERVGAADVVSRASEEATNGNSPEAVKPAPVARPAQPASAVEYSDLSIETNAERLVAQPALPISQAWFHIAGYASALALLLGGVAWRRRRDVDPAVRARQTAIARARQSLKAATSVADISHGVRQMIAELGTASASAPDANALREDVDALLAECDAAHYGGRELTSAELEALRDRALQLIARWKAT